MIYLSYLKVSNISHYNIIENDLIDIIIFSDTPKTDGEKDEREQ